MGKILVYFSIFITIPRFSVFHPEIGLSTRLKALFPTRSAVSLRGIILFRTYTRLFLRRTCLYGLISPRFPH